MEEIDAVNEKALIRKTWFLFVVTLFALCIFQSSALQTLAYDLPAGVWTERIIVAAEGWHNLMNRFGAAQVTENISEFVSHIYELQIKE